MTMQTLKIQTNIRPFFGVLTCLLSASVSACSQSMPGSDTGVNSDSGTTDTQQQTDNGTNDGTTNDVPTTVCANNSCPVVTQITGGNNSTCVRINDGTVRCWGDNDSGKLGDGTTTARNRPVTVSGVTDVVQVTTGYSHTCALRSNGTIMCWGAGSNGQLGHGMMASSLTPVMVSGITNAVDVSAGLYHTCAVLSDGTLQCWGRGGDLGSTSVSSSAVPVTVAALTGVANVEAGIAYNNSSNLFSCALLQSGAVHCWGSNDFGQLGNNTRDFSRAPVQVTGITNARAIAVGSEYACALLMDGTVSCWGDNSYGQLARDNVSLSRSLTPVPINGITGVTAITLTAGATCVLGSNNAVQCWGENSSGQLGRGFVGPIGMRNDPTPGLVMNTGTASVLGGGDGHLCVFSSDGATRCWGDNFVGEIGDGTDGTLADRPTPTPVFW